MLLAEIDPIVPFYGDERFSKLSPLRRIPVLIDGDLVLTDSDLEAVVVRQEGGTPILVRNVATVAVGVSGQSSFARFIAAMKRTEAAVR